MKTQNTTRPPLESLACVTPECELYGQPGRNNLTVRKVYGADQLRYLRCSHCGREFSERKGTALWNTKVREAQAVAVAAHLSEGCSPASTARLADVDIGVVQRLQAELGRHGQRFHEARVQAVAVKAVEGDERHGFSGTKQTPAWEAEMLDPQSKLVLAHVQGPRDEALIRQLLAETAQRVANRHDLVLFTDGEASYATFFPEYFGVPYQPARQGSTGRRPHLRYRIPRTLAHVQVVKRREGSRVVEVSIRYAHGSHKRVAQVLPELGYTQPNTSAIERRNATVRRMCAYQVRKSIAFARRPDTKQALGWWGVTVYNWCRPHRALRMPLEAPQDKKSSSPVHRPWRPDSQITFSRSGSSC